MLESLRICAIGDGCGFINPEALDRAEFHVLHGANAPAQDAATAAHANGQLMFLVPQQPVAGLPVSLYLNKARLQDVLKRGPNMCLQVGFNNWSVGVQKVRTDARVWHAALLTTWRSDFVYMLLALYASNRACCRRNDMLLEAASRSSLTATGLQSTSEHHLLHAATADCAGARVVHVAALDCVVAHNVS
jgi:hypothetical protein